MLPIRGGNAMDGVLPGAPRHFFEGAVFILLPYPSRFDTLCNVR